MTVPMRLAPEVADALATGAPVVALESTIITHGLARPENLETARAVEDRVRRGGAVPATIAVLDGTLCVGLGEDALAALSEAEGVRKLSRADLAIALAAGDTGSTTVSATMIAAHHAGIFVFATGGIGGVHRGAETSFDVSADLHELAQTPVSVVAAGAKAILDLPKTLEVLETLGVPVIGYRTDIFPAFWSRDSGLRAPDRMESAEAIASAHLMRRALALSGGQLIANPVPADAEIPAEMLAPVIAEAVHDAEAAGITGKAVTPYVLSRMRELTGGRSVAANVALVLNNAGLAADIAVALAAKRTR